MRTEYIIFMSACLILFLVLDPSSALFKDRFAHSQLIQDNSAVSQQQRIGTTNILDPPDDVSIVYGNQMNSSLDEQFIVLGNNSQGTNTNLAISNPNYGLSTPVPTITIGGNFNINSSTDADIVYTSATIKLVPITSPFPPSGMSIEDVDPENDISLGTPITIGNYTGDLGTFTIPSTAAPGYYILYVYFNYPAENITTIYNTAVQLKP
jgi:hypothetical protein